MWELLTGVICSSANSDLDLVVDLADPGSLTAAAAFLSDAQSLSPWRLDAEISIPHLGEVHWKEWLSNSETLLVKSLTSVGLHQRKEILAGSAS